MNRKSTIYTRSGDHGTSGLANGERRHKTEQRFQAMGALDELNAVLGMAHALLDDASLAKLVEQLQAQLFIAGAELALAKGAGISDAHVTAAEASIDRYDAQLPRMTHFILPGGSTAGAALHHARTLCRRSEREALLLARQEEVNSTLLIYLNRLSDLLFVLARYVNQQQGGSEVKWIP